MSSSTHPDTEDTNEPGSGSDGSNGSNGSNGSHVSYGPHSSVSASNGPIASLSTSELLSHPAFIRAASVLLQRTQFASLAGFDQYNGNREIFKVLGYPSHISFRDYRERFKRGGIARRIVKALPSMMGWSDFQVVERAIDEKGGKRKTKLERAWIDLNTREENPISVGSIFERADILAGIGEYSCIYIGVKESGSKGKDLKQEISRLKGTDSIVYLRPLDQESCEIVEWVDKPEDITDPRYGLPKIYRVRINGSERKSIISGQTVRSNTVDVHWSRVIHVTHEPLDNELFSDPVLEPVWNDLDDIIKLGGGGSEAFYREAVKRVLFDLDQNIGPDQIDQATKDKLKSDLEEMMHNLKQYVFTRGVTPKPIDNNLGVIRFAENIKCKIALIAATLDLPQRRIMGSESAYASADADKNTEEEGIQSRQRKFGSPVVRQFVDRMIKYNGLPKPSKPYEVVWATEGKKKFKFLAGIVRDFAQANQAQKNATGQTITTPDEIRDMVLDMEPLEIEEVEEADKKVDKPETETEEEKEVVTETEEPVNV